MIKTYLGQLPGQNTALQGGRGKGGNRSKKRGKKESLRKCETTREALLDGRLGASASAYTSKKGRT